MTYRSPLSRGALALAFLLDAGVARADEVNAEAPTDAPAADAAPVELPEEVIRTSPVEATRDPTAAVTVVSADRFAGEAKAVAELVATAPGVAVSDYGGLDHYATASIRGSTADGVLVLLDGLQLNTAFGGGVNLTSVPRQWIDRIEVVRGAEGAHYGAGALGGAVNIVTLPGRVGTWNVETAGGSFETWSASGDTSFRAGDFTVLAGASADGTSGRFPYEFDRIESEQGDEVTATRAHNGGTRGGGLVKLGGPLWGGRLDALAQVTGARRDIPRSDDPTVPSADWQEDGRAVALARVSLPGPTPDLGFTARAHLRVDRLDLFTNDVRVEQLGAAAGVGGEATWAHRGGVLASGLALDGETLDASGVGSTRTRGSAGVWVSDELTTASRRLRLTPALRYDQVGEFGGWSAKLGGSAALGAGFVLRASAGRTFRAPSFAELYLQQGVIVPNPDLVPEEGLAADGGVAWSGAAGMAAVNGFATLYRDLILYQLVSMQRLAPRNAGKALVTGLEVEAATAPARGLANLSLSGAYTFLVTENLRAEPESVGQELPHRARHRLYARASAAPGPVSLHVDAQYVGRQFTDTRNDVPIDAVLLWNAGASVRLLSRPRLALALEVKNALDDRTLDDSFDNPLPGRMVLVTLRAGAVSQEVQP